MEHVEVPVNVWMPLILLILLASSNQRPAFAGDVRRGTASWFSTETCAHNLDLRCPMADGTLLPEREANAPAFAAMWDVPLGSRVRVCHEVDAFNAYRRCLDVTIRDRGPAKRLVRQGRIIDLSQPAFLMLSDRWHLEHVGLLTVTVEPLQCNHLD